MGCVSVGLYRGIAWVEDLEIGRDLEVGMSMSIGCKRLREWGYEWLGRLYCVLWFLGIREGGLRGEI